MARHLRLARQACREPSSILPLLRGWLLNLWQARGGGFYGLGYVITFVTLEIGTLAGNIRGSEGVSRFVLGELIQYLLRISVESLINALLAFLWPLYALRWLGPPGIVVLVAGYFVFERGVRPSVEAWFPELREGRMRKARKKAERNASTEQHAAAADSGIPSERPSGDDR